MFPISMAKYLFEVFIEEHFPPVGQLDIRHPGMVPKKFPEIRQGQEPGADGFRDNPIRGRAGRAFELAGCSEIKRHAAGPGKRMAFRSLLWRFRKRWDPILLDERLDRFWLTRTRNTEEEIV